MRKLACTVAAATASLAAILASAPAQAAPTPQTTIGTPGAVVVGTFHKKLLGTSAFIVTPDGTTALVYGAYSRLAKNRAYFTVAYGNGVCDPAQAFPVGPFTTDNRGRATLAAAVPLNGVSLAGSGSVSVRIGDDATDQDGDGKTGPTDVVAVPGMPKIGLVECDRSPNDITP